MKPQDYLLLQHVLGYLEGYGIEMELNGDWFMLKNESHGNLGAFRDLNEIYQYITGYAQGVRCAHSIAGEDLI